MSRICLFASLLMAGLALSACQRQADGPLAINGKIFIFNVRLAKSYVQLTLARNGDVADGSKVMARFENPAGGADLEASQKVFPAMTRIDIASPDMHCIVKDRPYAITITLTDPEGNLRQTIETTLASTLDQTVMPAKPLVEGPAYDKNPDATGPDGKFLPETFAGCPK